MAKQNKKTSKDTFQPSALAKKHWRKALVLTGVLIVLVGVVTWYLRVYTSASNVFNAMIENNLKISSVSREVNQPICLSTTGSAGNIIQVTYFPELEAHCITAISDTSTKPPSAVLAETIGVRNGDYERYASIQKPGTNPDKYANVYKLWLKNGVDASSQKLLIKSLFNPILFGDVANPTREKIVTKLKQAYSVDTSRTQKTNVAGRQTYIYYTTIRLDKFAEAWNEYAYYYGFNKDYLIKKGTYNSANKLGLNIQVDALSRQVKSVNFQGVSEAYAAYGVSNPSAIPDKTYLPSQLQSALSQLK